MNVFIVYCHPSVDSFTYYVKEEFIKGLLDSGNKYVISDLYKMKFNSEISEEEYIREANYNCNLPVSSDVKREQEKINESNAITFIYPVFWTEAPSKLVGWFDRVWTYGFAYGERSMKKLDRALVLCIAGRTIEHLNQHGHLESMQNIMLGDRIYDRVNSSKMIVLDGTSKASIEQRMDNWDKHLKTAYNAGFNFFT
jgi:NAD(P)H dehydrogenase (quinone)